MSESIEINVKESELFEILRKNDFKNTFQLLEDLVGFIDVKQKILIKRPIKDYLKKILQSKMAAFIKYWKNTTGGYKRNEFMNKLENSFYKIEIKNEDIDKGPDVYEDLSKLSKNNAKLVRKLTRLEKTVENDIIKINRKRKSYFECEDKNKKRIKNFVKDNLTKWMQSYGLGVEELKLYNLATNTEDSNNFTVKVSEKKSKSASIDTVLAIKDICNMSDQAYTMVRKHCANDWPSIHYIKEERKLKNLMFPVEEHDGGAYTSFKNKLNYLINLEQDQYYVCESIRIKFTADSTNIGKNLHLLNIAFVILNDTEKAKNSKGQYSVGIYDIEKENYETIKSCFELINKEIDEIDYITVRDKKVKVEYFVGADWKMLANLLGIVAANGKNPCIWCMANKDEFWDITNEWSLNDSERGARTFNKDDEKEPILTKKIPISNYLVDMLHLFLRITDTLFGLLVENIRVMDEVKVKQNFNTSPYTRLNKLEKFIKDDCKIKFKFSASQTKNSDKIEYKSLNGPEKHKIFSQIKIREIIGDEEGIGQKIETIWSNFYKIFNQVKKNELTHEEVKLETSNWLKNFLNVYESNKVTPYMHTFVSHLHEFVRLYEDVNQFTTQGLEKMNDLCTGYYFRSNNKRDNPLVQLLHKRNRIEINNYEEEY
jgi:hypothetical protein